MNNIIYVFVFVQYVWQAVSNQKMLLVANLEVGETVDFHDRH